VRLETELSALFCTIDRVRPYRALANLLANAIQYSPDGDDVTVTLTTEGDGAGTWAVIRVSDHGIGIPAADLPQVFERFYRAGNVGQITGNGIGLAGVRQLVEHHGGRITISSEPGVGTTVTVYLLLDSPANPSSALTKQALP
jgi:signal transduction histidine kinase